MDLHSLYQKSLKKIPLTLKEGLFLISCPNEQVAEMFNCAEKLRNKFKGKKVKLCSIVNARSGRCSENCSFCAQSAHHKSKVNIYPLLSLQEMLAAAKEAYRNGAGCFSLVTSGRGINKAEDFTKISLAIKKMPARTKSASLGILSIAQLLELKKNGLKKYHHNLETAKSFFPKMCSTHSYRQRVQTIKNAKKLGLQVCSGGIFNIGESPRQRVELALALRKLKVDSVPINILHPIPGTKIYQNYRPLPVLEILKLIATYRFILPDKDIGVMGGREYNLKDQQGLIFSAGANGILIGNYLTTKGNKPEQDKALIKKAGLSI